MKNRWFPSILFISISAVSVGLDAQWVRQESGVDSLMTDVVMIDSMTAYAVSHGRSILRTTNRGDTWFDMTAPLSYVAPWNGLAFYDSGSVIAVGEGGLIFTIKGGSRSGWCRNITGNTNTLFCALFLSPANIYVGADTGWIYHSLDSGKTWTSEKISEWPIRSLFTYRGPTAGVTSVYALTSHSVCSKTEFPAVAWSEQLVPQLQALGGEAFDGDFANGGGSGFIVGVGGDLWASPLILRKTLSDTSWNTVTTSIPGAGPLYGVSVPSSGVVYACGTWGNIIKSTDGGDNWVSCFTRSQIEDPNLRAIYFIDETHGFAVGERGSVFYTSNGGLTNVGGYEPDIPRGFVLGQNYPNPFNPSTAISYQLSAISDVSLIVYDMLGREVAALVDNELKAPGKYWIHWDGTNRYGEQVASGVYLYRLSTQFGSQVRKAVVMR